MASPMATAPDAAGEPRYQIAARLERLPEFSWHRKMRLIVGTAWFFDSFDQYSIAYALPVLIPIWGLTPTQVGTIIAVGSAGQVLGSIGFGWLGERIGRIPVMVVTVLMITLMSFACAFTWNFQSLLVARFIQGLGLGGEVPTNQTYITEFAKSQRRGRFALLLQLVFVIGISCVALASIWVVPHLGWQALFFIGTVPALLTIPLRRMLPESPRWLATSGRLAEADQVLKRLEDGAVAEGRILPPLPLELPVASSSRARFADLFKGRYRRRTLSLWAIYFSTYFLSYGFQVWLPSLYRVYFKVPIEQALQFGFIGALATLCGSATCAFIVDRTGRKPLFMVSLSFAALALVVLSLIPDITVMHVVVLASISAYFIGILALGFGIYAPENYPNHLRALGTGVAGAWPRVASMAGPLAIGLVLPLSGLPAVFALFGAVGVFGSLIHLVFSIETRGRVLEELSPEA
jgi:putative MFS transporter